MPLDRDDLNPEQAERLHRKIERLIAGQPSPVLDGDTEELAEIARLLYERLPKDIPDPGFRAQLKKDLIEPGPRLVPFRPPRRSRRYPIAALTGALALVVVATTVVGMLALDLDVADGPARQSLLVATPTAPLSAAAIYASSSMTAEPRATEQEATQEESPLPAGRELSATDIVDGVTPAPTMVDVEPTPAADSPSQTEILTVVDLPPVDESHVEFGALATVAARETTDRPPITYTLVGDLPELESSALAYHFATPHVDPQLILRGVSDFLGIEPNVEMRTSFGRTVYSLGSPDSGPSFTLKPESGAFACILPDAHSTADIADLSASAIAWLKEFGYPVDEHRVRPVIETRATGEQLIHVPLVTGSEIPEPVLGHPLRITLVVDPNGRIVRVSGYWLEATNSHVVPLLSAEQAWRRLSAGEGYWPSDTAPRSPGKFSVESFSIRYMLTVDTGGRGLVLQPVIAATGTFSPDDGTSPYESTVYLQAAAQL